MISSNLSAALRRPPLFNQRVFCVAYTVSIGIYWFVLFFTAERPLVRTVPASLKTYCSLAAVAVVVASVIYRRRALSTEHLSGLLQPVSNPEELARDPRTGKVLEDFLRRIEVLSASERRFLALFVRFQTCLIISLALNQVVALLGFVACYLDRQPVAFLPFAVVATGLNVWVWPSVERLHERVAGQILVNANER
jgi:hypothetical protein